MNIQDQPIIICRLPHTRIFDLKCNLANWRKHRINRYHLRVDDILCMSFSRHVAPPKLYIHGHFQDSIFIQCCNMQIRIQNFNIRICHNIPCGNLSRTRCLQRQLFGSIDVHFQQQLFDIKNNFRRILQYAGNRRKLVIDPLNLHRRHCSTGQR